VITTTEHDHIGGMSHRLWDVYRNAMEPTRADAVQRHMLTREEFDAVCWNTNLTKVVARESDGSIVGLSVYTNQLDAYDWIEPAYFEKRWPEQYKANAVFYIIFVVTNGSAPGTFEALVSTMGKAIAAAEGIGALDWSSARIERGLDRAARAIISKHMPLSDETVDRQQFHTYTFDWDA
jgi:hypothetical protein